jgi:hypothetical protein
MGTRKSRRKKDGDSGKGGGDAQPPEEEEQRGPGVPEADPVRIHQEFIERHLGGGEPATQEVYERAVEQWNELPGAVRVPPTRLPEDAPARSEDEEREEDEEGGDQGRPT